MLDLICENCKKSLVIDYTDTINSFLKDVDYLKQSLDFIKQQASCIKVRYFCSFCDTYYDYTFEEIFNHFIARVEYDVKNYKKIHIFKNYINPRSINPDNGVVFCNNCLGIDGIGNCYLDIYNQCPYKGTKDEL